jgi:hypothetical protein
MQEADGHATYIRNVACALRERLAYSTLLEPCSTRAEHSSAAASSRSSHSKRDQESEQAGHRAEFEGQRVHPGFPAHGQAAPSIPVQALQFTATTEEVRQSVKLALPAGAVLALL